MFSRGIILGLQMPAEDVIRVSTVNDGAAEPSPENLLALLDESEVARAHRSLGSPSTARFVTARAASRVILGRLLGVAPRDVPISIGRYGRPELKRATTCFNISHTKGLILVAVREAGPVGIDVETLRRQPPRSDVQRQTLTPAETKAFDELSPAVRWRTFLQAWSRKEAYAKGLGLGLGLGFDFQRMDVGWAESGIIGDPVWEVRSLRFPHPHVGAVAAPGVGWRMAVGAHSW